MAAGSRTRLARGSSLRASSGSGLGGASGAGKGRGAFVNKPIGTVRACRVANSQQWSEFVHAHVGEFIASLEDAGLSHWDIAYEMGCNRSTVSQWKNGRADMTAKAFFALKALADLRGAKRKAVGT